MGNNGDKIEKTDAEWRQLLSDDEFHICREAGTERAFSGEYWNTKEPGSYLCKCCGEALFEADSKYDSGSGWPSFYEPAEKARITEHRDNSLGMERVEVNCARCGSHLGHVFPDGPQPTGLRYCINSASLSLKKAD